nr:MAG TPA: hypothetical protein [Caudoviricetes sp.]
MLIKERLCFCVNKFYILILTEINKLYKYFIQNHSLCFK